MSVDVFGRKLGRTEGGRGPPGVGYKITEDGQYDVNNKRLCNVAAPNQLTDAVNLDTLQKLLRMEIQGVMNVMSRFRSRLDNLDLIMEAHRDEIDAKLSKIDIEMNDIRDE